MLDIMSKYFIDYNGNDIDGYTDRFIDKLLETDEKLKGKKFKITKKIFKDNEIFIDEDYMLNVRFEEVREYESNL